MKKMNMPAILAIIAVVGILGFIAYNSAQQSQLGQTSAQIIAAGGCENEPYIDNNTVDFYLRGTAAAPAYKYVLDGEAGDVAKTLTMGSSGTKFSVGDKIIIFTTLANYLDSVEEFEVTSCGSNVFENTLYNSASGAAVLDILYESTLVTDGTANNALNITGAASAGLSVTYTVRIDGITDDSSGDMLLTIEGNDTEISAIELTVDSGVASIIDSDSDGSLTALKLFAAEGTAPTLKKAFVIGPVNDGERAQYNVKLISETSEILGAADGSLPLYHNLYAAQWFVDDDGTLQYGFEDSDGTLKYENKYGDHDANVV